METWEQVANNKFKELFDEYKGSLYNGEGADSVKFSTIEKDVNRRDLTINALFLSLHSGDVVDLVGDLEDIKNNVVRAVGNPYERLAEDKLRAFRAVRFASRFENAILDKELTKAIKEQSMYGISKERIREEFLKGLKTSHSVKNYLILLEEHGLLNRVIRMSKGFNFDNYPKTNTRYMPFIVAWLLNWSEISCYEYESFLNKACYTNAETREIVWLQSLMSESVSTISYKPNNAFKVKKQQTKLKVSYQTLSDWIYVWCDEDKRKELVALLNYELSVVPTQLMNEGFQGIQLGNEIQARELNVYTQILEATTIEKNNE